MDATKIRTRVEDDGQHEAGHGKVQQGAELARHCFGCGWVVGGRVSASGVGCVPRSHSTTHSPIQSVCMQGRTQVRRYARTVHVAEGIGTLVVGVGEAHLEEVHGEEHEREGEGLHEVVEPVTRPAIR